MKKSELINFEKDIKQMYIDGKLRSPIHLSGGNEIALINIFKNIQKEDWIFSTWRSHYHALLKGINKNWLKNWVLDNKSIHVMNKEHKFFTSAIVGGIIPIALGVAWSIKLKGGTEKVWCFIGDMTANTGSFRECHQFAKNFHLPIKFIIEDNQLSTDTPTKVVWGYNQNNRGIKNSGNRISWFLNKKYVQHIIYYKYKRIYPHYGCGVFVDFKDRGLEQGGKHF